ncbi:hypothetical protein D1007_24483 [Hordeum vulgare]|nr:hypothetical protein D1007_24483 [Hordeum vulgare]
MAAATPDGGGVVGGYEDLPDLGDDDHVGLEGSSSSYYIGDKEEEEEASLSMDQRVRLAEMWMANPTTSHHLTIGVGGVFLDEDIWEVRIHFDAREPLERKLSSSNITYLNLVALVETQGFHAYDCLFHISNPYLGKKRLDLVDCNSELQMIKSTLKRNIADVTLVLNMLARACPSPLSEFVRQECDEQECYDQECDEQQCEEQQCDEQEWSTIVYEGQVFFDLSDTPIFVVDQHGVVFESLGRSSTRAHLPRACTQESKNVNDKLKCVLEEEEGYKYDVYEDSDGDLEMEEGKRHREQEVLEEEEESDDEQPEEEELLHYEGDTEVEEPFQVEEDNTLGSEEEIVNKKQKLPVRTGPTTRSHSSKLPEVELDFKPSSDEEEKGLLKDSDDDGFEPLSFVPPKKRKSREKKRPARKWFNEKMDQPHEQLCLKLCFKDHHQFRDALLNLHITQSRIFKYHRNSDPRIIVECREKQCQFFMAAAVIKGEKTFVIKKMRLDHTCPTSTETTRVSAKWLAWKYEHLFRYDPTTHIQTIIDVCMEKYGVDVPKSMAYRAKNIAIEAVLGDHKLQYPRLRDYA